MFLNHPVIHHFFESLDSTSIFAKKNYNTLDLKKLHLITAAEQSAGKGTKGKKWFSPKGVNIYGTFVFAITDRPLLSLATIGQILAISIASSLKSLDLSPTIKWPNDLLLNNKKVCGILAETLCDQKEIVFFLGFGLNVNMSEELCNSLDQKVTSLYLCKGFPLCLNTTLQIICDNFQKDLSLYLEKGFSHFQDLYNSLMIYKNYPVFFEKTYLGLSKEVTVDGFLNILTEDNILKPISCGSILI